MKYIVSLFVIIFIGTHSFTQGLDIKKVNFGFTLGRSIGYKSVIGNRDYESLNSGAKIGFYSSSKYSSSVYRYNYGAKIFAMFNFQTKNRILVGLDYQQFGKRFEYRTFSSYPAFASTNHYANVSYWREINGVHKIFSVGCPINYEFVSHKKKLINPFFSVGIEPRIIVGNSSNQEYVISTSYNMLDSTMTQIPSATEKGISKYSIDIPSFNSTMSVAVGIEWEILQKMNCRLEIFTSLLIRRIESEKDGAGKVPSQTGSAKDNYMNFGTNFGLYF